MHNPRAKTWLVLIGVIVLVLAGLEVSARVYLCHFASDEAFFILASTPQFERHGEGRTRFQLHHYLGYISRPGYADGDFSIGSQGYRGRDVTMPKPPGEYRIAWVGGSSTMDTDIAKDSDTACARLETMLRESGFNARVINAGTPGWTSYESLLNFHLRLKYLQPDLLIVGDGWNDLTTRVVSPVAYYTSDNGGAKAGAPVRFPLCERSTILRTLRILTGKAYPHMAERLVHDAKVYYGHCFHSVFRRPGFENLDLRGILRENPPIYFESNQEALYHAASATGAEVLFLTFNFSKTGHAMLESFGIDPNDGEMVQLYIDAFEEMNAAVRRTATRLGARLLDVDALFPQSERFEDFYSDGFHSNEAGADKKAAIVFEYLREEVGLPAATAHASGP